jgi:hypothetical protein
MFVSGTGNMADIYQVMACPWDSHKNDITRVVIEDGVTSIGAKAFYDCSYEGLTSINIPASVTSIGIDAFAYCYSMTSIAIPASVTSIGDGAFRNCSALATVTLNSNPYIGEHAFDDIKAGATVTMNLTANAADGAYWTTFYNMNYRFKADANTQVFKAEQSGTKLTMHEVTEKIVMGGTPVVLKTTGGNPVMTLTTEATDNDDHNSLSGVSDPAGEPANGHMYVLNYKAATGVGFYKLADGSTLGVGKAFLYYSGSGAPSFFGFDVDDENTTAINEHESHESHELSGAWYDLQGRKIANGQKPTAKGLYIVNGKKVVIK